MDNRPQRVFLKEFKVRLGLLKMVLFNTCYSRLNFVWCIFTASKPSRLSNQKCHPKFNRLYQMKKINIQNCWVKCVEIWRSFRSSYLWIWVRKNLSKGGYLIEQALRPLAAVRFAWENKSFFWMVYSQGLSAYMNIGSKNLTIKTPKRSI